MPFGVVKEQTSESSLNRENDQLLKVYPKDGGSVGSSPTSHTKKPKLDLFTQEECMWLLRLKHTGCNAYGVDLKTLKKKIMNLTK